MKSLLTNSFLLLIGISCQTSPCTMKASEFNSVGAYQGIVHLKEAACPIYIEITGAFSKSTIMEYRTIYPVNLEKKYQKNGLSLQFNYSISRAMSPEGCQTDAIVSLSEVQIFKEKRKKKNNSL